MNRGNEVLVGGVIIAAVTVAVFGSLWLQGTNFGRPRIPVQVLLESVGQLGLGNAVTFRGVPIGQVDAIVVEPGSIAVRVTLLVDQTVTLPEDPGVILSPESLFGAWQAEIVSKTSYPGFPFYEVQDGLARTPPVLGGYALPELSRLTASADQISQNLSNLTDRLELAFNQETADNLARAISNIEAITQEIRTLVQTQGEVAASITASADSALVEIELAAQSARRSFDRMEGIMAGADVDSVVTNLAIASAGFRRITEDLADPNSGIGATLKRADSAFARADRIAAGLEAGEGSLGRLLADTAFVVRAEGVLTQLSLLLLDFRENPHRYVRLSIF